MLVHTSGEALDLSVPARAVLAGRDASERAQRLRERHRGGEVRTGTFMLDLVVTSTHLARVRRACGCDPRADGVTWPLSELLVQARGPSTPKLVDQMVASVDAVADQVRREAASGQPLGLLALQVRAFGQAAVSRRFKLSGVRPELAAVALEDYLMTLV